MISISNKKEKLEKEEIAEEKEMPEVEEAVEENPSDVKEESVEVPEEAPADSAETEAAEESDAEAFGGKESKKKSRKEKKEAEKLAEKDQEIALLNDKYLRLCAEYDNYRKRSQKEKDSRYNDAKEDVIAKMLPVYDNLARALEQKTEDEAYYKGVEMIMTQFNTALEKLGVEAIPALGEKFNPEIHNAVMHVDDDSKGENEIVAEFQKGFKLGDKIIRFSMVKVAN